MTETTVIVELGCVAFAAGLVLLRIYFVRSWGKCTERPDLRGKTVVITGGNSGIGQATAREMAKRGARVIMGCRDEARAEAAIKQLVEKDFLSREQLIFKPIDLTSVASVSRFAEDLINSEPAIDCLINNAGVFQCPFSLTEDGFESQFATNHLSQALLTMLLLPKLTETGSLSEPARIVLVTSTLYKYGKIREKDFHVRGVCPESYDKRKSYQSSKLYALIFNRELSKKLVAKEAPVNVYITSPGIVWTNLGRHIKKTWWKVMFLAPISALFLRTPTQGCQSVVNCAVSEKLRGSTGRFYRNCAEAPFHENAKDPKTSRDVFDWTLKSISAVKSDFKGTQGD